jgi:hypothetical protein
MLLLVHCWNPEDERDKKEHVRVESGTGVNESLGIPIHRTDIDHPAITDGTTNLDVRWADGQLSISESFVLEHKNRKHHTVSTIQYSQCIRHGG